MDALAHLLQISDDLTTTSSPTTSVHWSDVSLAEWDHLLMAIDSVPESTTADTPPTRTPPDDDALTSDPQRPCQSLQYRQRKRLELAQLRNQVAELQATLHDLHTARSGGVNAMVSVPPHSPVALAWKRIAAHQQAARRLVEAENVRLKTTLERELRVAHKLQMLIRKRASLAQDWTQPHAKRARQEQSQQTRIFDQLRQEIGACVVNFDALLYQVGFATSTTDLERIRVCSMQQASVEWEILLAKVFPFGYKRTAEVVWGHCASTSPSAISQGVVTRTDTHIEMLFELPARVRHCDVVIGAHVVMRRSKEPSRIVEWYEGKWVLQSENDAYDGITLRDRGWHVFYDLADENSGGASSSAIVQCFNHLQLDTSRVSQPDDVQVVRQVFIDVYNQHLQNAFTIFESALLDQDMLPVVT